MNRPVSLAFLALALALSAAPAVAAPFDPPVPPEGPVGARRVSTDRIVPRSFNFTDLAPLAPGSENIPITLRREHEWQEAAEEVERLKANPPILPATSFAQFTYDTTPPAVNGKGGFTPLAPTIGNGFEGITQAGFIPSEPTVGGGPLNIFTCGNVNVTVTNKDGTNRVETNGATFFGVPAAEGAISDAQCYYDALHGRFVAVCFTQGTTPSNFSNFYLVISKTNDARGAWWQYKFDMTKDGAVQTANWSDYEGLGISEDKIVFSGQQFTFAGERLRVPEVPHHRPRRGLQRRRVVARGHRQLRAARGRRRQRQLRHQAGAQPHRPATTPSTACACARARARASPTAPSPARPRRRCCRTGNLVAVSAYSAPPDAAQPGTATLVATNDCRPSDFYVRNGVLIAAWHTAATRRRPCRAIRLFRMRTSDRVVLTDETFGAGQHVLLLPGRHRGLGRHHLPGLRPLELHRVPVGVRQRQAPRRRHHPAERAAQGRVVGSPRRRAGAITRASTRTRRCSRPAQTVAWYAGQWNQGARTSSAPGSTSCRTPTARCSAPSPTTATARSARPATARRSPASR